MPAVKGLPLLDVHDPCPDCLAADWLVYVWYRGCAVCGYRDETTTTYQQLPMAPRDAGRKDADASRRGL
jgi:hypothetical protein